MNVTIKRFDVQMELKNSGIEFEVRTPAGVDHLGDMVVNKSGMTWCPGRVQVKNGTRKSWEEIIEFFNS